MAHADQTPEHQLQRLRSLMAGFADRGDEAAIVALLREASPDQLNYLLANVDLNHLFCDLDDRLFGPDHLTSALTLLCRERQTDFNLDVRARIVFARQSGPTLNDQERVIRDLLLGVRGRELTAFKNLLNGHGTHHDLEKLLFDDIDDDEIRDEILNHITREAQATPSGERKILCDIDDTVFARLKDNRYPSKIVYPGVLAFLQELDLGAGIVPGEPGDVTFVTARPMDALGVIENHTRETLEATGLRSLSVLSGSFLNLTSHSSIAAKKFDNFRRYLRAFPEYGFVFVGDSGQGDVMFGERMLQEAPEAVDGVFIHDVVNTSAEDRAAWKAKGIVFFDTYVGAALAAREANLMSNNGLQRVVVATTETLAALPFATIAQRDDRIDDLKRDLARAEAVSGKPLGDIREGR